MLSKNDKILASELYLPWKLTTNMSRAFSVASENAILDIVEREHVTADDVRRCPEKTQSGEKRLWYSANNLPVNYERVVDIDEKGEAAVDWKLRKIDALKLLKCIFNKSKR